MGQQQARKEDCVIGIQLAGKNNRISASVFARSLNSFLDLIGDVDSNLSERPRGSVRWEIASLQKNSPALVEIRGVSRIQAMDYSQAIQDSVLDGIDQLAERPEQPKFYSYSALKKVHRMADQARHLKWLSVFSGSRRAVLTERVVSNVEYLIASGSKSLGSVRGSLDSITVHSGNEFRIWLPNLKRPVVCIFEKAMLPEVIAHLKQKVEVFGELQRNPKGEPVLVKVEEFIASEPRTILPSVADMCGLVSDLYGGESLKGYMEGLRDN
jgi:hypothetical protein